MPNDTMPLIEAGDWVRIKGALSLAAVVMDQREADRYNSLDMLVPIEEIRKADGRRFLRVDGQWQEVPRG